MSALEQAVRPALEPMIEGIPTMLTSADVRVVRAWAAKMALNFGFTARGIESSVPRGLAESLYAQRQSYGLPPGAEVWVAAYEPLGQFAYRHMVSIGSGLHPISGRRHELLRTVFIAGHAVFYVRMPDCLEGRGLVYREPLPEFTPLFDVPVGRSIAWYRGALDDFGISTTMNRHIEGGVTDGEHLQTWVAPPGAEHLP